MGFDTHNLKKFDITDMDVPHGIYADEDICLSTQKRYDKHFDTPCKLLP